MQARAPAKVDAYGSSFNFAADLLYSEFVTVCRRPGRAGGVFPKSSNRHREAATLPEHAFRTPPLSGSAPSFLIPPSKAAQPLSTGDFTCKK